MQHAFNPSQRPAAVTACRTVFRGLLALVLLGMVLGACSSPGQGGAASASPERLRIGLIPNQSPDTVKAQYEPFRKYMEGRLDRPVELFVASDYAGVVEAMASDRLDVAYFGGVTYVQAEQRARVHPIVTEVDRDTHTTKYHSVIITNSDSPIRTVADVKGRKFAFGDIGSTSGSLYPRIMLSEAGITSFGDPKLFIYTGGHDATALAVQNGAVDAGGVEERILNRLIDRGTVDASRIRVIARSSPIEGYPWVVRDALHEGLVEEITSAFLGINDPELLKLMRAERYEGVTEKDYDEIRAQARRFGLISPSKK